MHPGDFIFFEIVELRFSHLIIGQHRFGNESVIPYKSYIPLSTIMCKCRYNVYSASRIAGNTLIDIKRMLWRNKVDIKIIYKDIILASISGIT